MYEKYDWDFDNYLEEDMPAAVRCLFLWMAENNTSSKTPSNENL